jgi:MGT family glycosyltransferase
MLMFAAPLVAEILNVPRVHVMLQPAAMLSAHDPMPPPGMMWMPPLSPATWKVLWRLARQSTRPWFRELEAFRAELGLPNDARHPFFDSHSPHLNLALFSRELAPPQPDWPERTVQTGFLFGDTGHHPQPMPEALARFFDTGSPPLVFTLGSTGVWDPGPFYHEAARAAEILRMRAVLLTGAPGGVDFPLPSDVIACEYAPHREVFPRAAAIIHHGGVGTTAEALRAGRPMVIVPYSHDQPDNARRCRALGVARVVRRSRARAERLARELKAVLEDPAMAPRAREVGERVRAEAGARAAADAILALVD